MAKKQTDETNVAELLNETASETTTGEPTPPTGAPSGPQPDPDGEPLAAHAGLVLSVMVPIEDEGDYDFGPLIAAIEKTVGDVCPAGFVLDTDEVMPDGEPPVEAVAEEIPDGCEARVIILTNVQWQAIDRQTRRHNLTASEYLRRFLSPYLR